jgi:serine/threonine protein kinase
MEAHPHNRMLGRYEILEQLGEGGMGVVFKGRDTRMASVVALKFLATGFLESPEACDRSLCEARAIAALNHPNIATIYEIGESDGAPSWPWNICPVGRCTRASARGRFAWLRLWSSGFRSPRDWRTPTHTALSMEM